MIVKKSFPDATFGNISKIVAAEWDSLGKHEKEVCSQTDLSCRLNSNQMFRQAR
ncbi:unnamed protein product [Cylicostephanus goldi]|uniref:HMG box domain-containing protein n=1 Tax=Cylicostephanus goldi TaxID=71465 RepID=A0A3P7NDY3_CYLGO|nr:unnamed protein product [Cylicostephanus goldi]